MGNKSATILLFQAQLRAYLAKLWDLEGPTQVRSSEHELSGDIDYRNPECPIHTPSLHSSPFFFLSEATSSIGGSGTTQGRMPGGEFLVQDLELSLFLYLGFCGEKMNGKEYERGTWHIYSFKYSGASWMKSETWLSNPQRERWDQREANHSRLVGSRFNKQGNLTYKSCLGQLVLSYADK